MSDFLRELEEDIQEEKILNLWHKYGNYLIGLALAIIIATAGYTLWRYFHHKGQLRAHASFSSAVKLYNDGKKEEALKAFQGIAQGKGGYAKLARLYEATLTFNPSEIYNEMARRNVSDPAFGNLPKVLLAAREFDNRAALEAIQPLTAPNNAWASLSYELLGFANLKKGDEIAAAKNFIAILKEPYASDSERMRASLMLTQIEVPDAMFEQEERKSK
ncbi:MAG: tetratricopeptide repeat protein [Alphaproteobacteria bacterium]|nr:tetratricopeptide repeat protein [Alphaproteobacteria bacterium]